MSSGVEVSVPQLCVGLGGRGAVAFVAELDGDTGGGGGGEGGIYGVEARVVACGSVGGVDGGVAEAAGLRHYYLAARGASVERRGEARDVHVEAEVPLDDGDHRGGLDHGAAQ